jgi:serine/threonine protein phosphatase PrpC
MPNSMAGDRPTLQNIDAWGMSHVGLRRTENQDHFFIGSLALGVDVIQSSLPENVVVTQRVASLAVVADGVGSTDGGGEASQLAVTEHVQQVMAGFQDALAAEATDPNAFVELLSKAALTSHQRLLDRQRDDPGERRYATTLTLFLGLWPHAYILQVGDSRCYAFYDGELRTLSRDQTMAQELIDQGVLSVAKARESRWASVLSSAIGGSEIDPVVTRMTRDWGTVLLLCSDGLTKHVPDDRIRDCLATMTSARQACEDLVQAALDGGGTDNITVAIGRTRAEPALG